jgi:putative PEP-CTERM system TPR-repeat lipoprotein
MTARSPCRHPGTALAVALACSLFIAGCGRDSPEALAKAGDALLAKGDPAGAVVQYKAAVQQDGGQAGVRLQLGRALLASGDAINAAVELNKARELGTPPAEVVPLLARAIVATGDHKRLVNQFEGQDLGNASANAALKVQLATAWAALGNPVKSRAALDGALAAQPQFGPAQVLQARLQAAEGNVDQALADLEKVLAADPKLTEAWIARGELLALGKGDRAAARKAFERALAIDPFSVPAHSSLASLAAADRDVPGIRTQAAALRKVLPQHPHALYMEAQADLVEGKPEAAREKAQQLLRVGPDNVGVLMLAGAAEGQLRSYVIAESHFVKAMTIDPQSESVRRSLALTYVNLGQHPRALDVLKPLIGPDSRDAAALALAGEATLRNGDPRAAEQLFTRAAQRNPGDPYVKTSLAMTQMQRGNIDRAFDELRAVSASDSTATVADMAIISARFARSEWPAALKAIDVAIAKTPKDPALLELRGRAQIAGGNPVAGRASFEEALAIDPKYFAAAVSLTRLDLQEKKVDEAARRLQAAMKADPRNVYAGLGLAEVRAKAGAPVAELQKILADTISANPTDGRPRVALVDMLLRAKNIREALQVGQDAGAALPNDAAVLDALARAQMAAGETQQALSSYRRLTNVDPKDVRVLQRLAELYRAAGDRKNAEAMWRRIAEVQPQFQGIESRIVELLMADKRGDEALAEARSMQPRSNTMDSVIGYLYEATVHQRAKAFVPMADSLRAGLKQHPGEPEIAIRLYQALLATGRKDEAARLAERWPKDNPKDGEFETELANGYLANNDVANAERVLRAVTTRLPNQIVALNNLAYVLASQKKPGGVALVERALAASAENASMLDTFALALSVEGQLPRAVDVQRRAVNLAPEDPMLRLNLARLALQAGDKATARDELDALAARGRDFPLHAEVLKLQRQL